MRGSILPLAIAGSMAGVSPALAAEQWTPVARDPSVQEVPFDSELFKADPDYAVTYDPESQIEVYGGKHPIDNPKPPIEIGRGLYDPGVIGDGIKIFGPKNRVFPQFSVFGDIRTAVAFNDNGNKETAVVAARANLDFDLQLTGTERLHMLWQPLQQNNQFTHCDFGGDDQSDCIGEPGKEPTTLFFEGDLGAIVTSITNEYQSFDLPFAVGLVPLLFQNGVWYDDAVLGGAFTIPARNSATLDISNFDLTFFFSVDELTSNAITNAKGKRAEHSADIYGVAGFFDVAGGYLEAGYAYINDTQEDSGSNQSYNNFTVAFSRRWFDFVSNGTRLIANFGQDEPVGGGAKTASGAMLISENSFVTNSITLIPYANFFIGIDSPQKAAGTDGLLKNVGLSFETDALTGFPRLDDTGHDAMGGALGVEYLFGFDQQLVGEVAFQTPWDNEQGIKAPQIGLAMRYQRPLTNRLIFRADAMYGLLFELPDIAGVRAELRLKL